MDPITEEELNLLNYFWNKGSVDGWVGFDALAARRPDIAEAVNEYKRTTRNAKLIFEAKLAQLSDEVE